MNYNNVCMTLLKYISLFLLLKVKKVPYYPVRFNLCAKYYEVFNYSTLKWISIEQALLFSKLEFLFLEKEKFFMLGSAVPEQFKKFLSWEGPELSSYENSFSVFSPFFSYLKMFYFFYSRCMHKIYSFEFYKVFREIFANLEGFMGPLVVSGLYVLPFYEKEAIWVFTNLR